MTVNKSKTHYSCTIHGQPNVNASYAGKRNDWYSKELASSKNGTEKPKGSISSTYSYQKIKKTIYDKKPWTCASDDFKFSSTDIPDCAYIKKITFTVRIKVTGKNINIKAPTARFNFYHGTKTVKDNRKDNNGWEGGYLKHTSSNVKKLSNSWQDVQYIMTGAEFYSRGYPVKELREERMGIDLGFFNNESSKRSLENYVYIQYVSCTVDYELPDQSIKFNQATSGDNPLMCTVGENIGFPVTYYNKSNAGCCNGASKKIEVKLPPNMFINDEWHKGDYNEKTSIWTVQCTPNRIEELFLHLKPLSTGLQKITLTNPEIGTYDYWIYAIPSQVDEGQVKVYPRTIQKGVKSCMEFHANVNAHDGMANFTVNMDMENNSNPNVVWNLDTDQSSEGVTLDTSSDNTHANFNVPADTVVDIVWTGCFIPRFDGNSAVSIKLPDKLSEALDDGNAHATSTYQCLPIPKFIVTNKPQDNDDDRNIVEIYARPHIILITSERVATTTKLGAYVIDCGIANWDSNMVIDDCTLTATSWEQIPYIGVLPLEHSHYDPDSTYSNEEIFKSYKNKVYAGKTGETDEEISLKFKARPWHGATLQGMVDLDKPTPINTVPLAFEGDILNHRGWAVLSEVKAKKTNPLWYDYEAKVKYITHDINTKFEIIKAENVNNVNMPDLQVDVFSLGENLSNGLDIFNVDTDGGFIYDNDSENVKNLFSLDEGQHLTINTINSLTTVSNIRFDWYSNRINEFRENNMERVFRLKDANGESIFEYEYTNLRFVENFVIADIIIRVKNNMEEWDIQTRYDVDLKTEIEIDPITVDDGEIVTIDETEEYEEIDEESDIEDPVEYDDDGIPIIADEDPSEDDNTIIAPNFDKNDYDLTYVYGSSLVLHVNGNKLNIYDEGNNGREITIENIELRNSQYYFETEWINHNQDGTTDDIISYIDISLNETILNSMYSEEYKNIIVSPYPIPHKKVIFTRESEEGTIYYLKDDNNPFKFLLEPFYQYLCGTDLVARANNNFTSIFNLNNSYTYYYIENGLIRLGFNKFSGSLYLAKWDIVSKDWITTHYLHLGDDIKFSMESYSDDKIVIKAGNDTYFTIWRGHPYVMINNPTRSITIDSKFNYCYSDKIEGDSYDYPIIASFMNTDNLLPNCIGGKTLDYDCINIDDDIISNGTDHTLTVNINTDITANEDTTISATLTPSTADGEIHYIVDGVDEATVTSPFTWTAKFPNNGKHEIMAVYVGDDDDNIAVSDKVTFNVNPPEPKVNSYANTGTNQAKTVTGKYKLSIISAPSSMTYRDGSKVILQLTRGNTLMSHLPLEIQLVNGGTITVYTDAKGQYSIINNSTEYIPGKYQWGGRFYDNRDEDGDKELLYKALKWITISKAKPKFTINKQSFVRGDKVQIKLNGVDSIKDPSKAGLKNVKVIYSINGAGKKTKVTNANGKISFSVTKSGVYKINVSYAGSKRYEGISKSFTFKVI